MFQILMSVEKELPRVQLAHDAGHGPNVAYLVPDAILKDDFRRTILPSLDYQRVAFVVIRGSPEVNHSHLRVERPLPRSVSLFLRGSLRLLPAAGEVVHLFVTSALFAAEDLFLFEDVLRNQLWVT